MKILIVTDGWYPQVSGVVRTYSMVIDQLVKMGHETAVISPDQFRTLPCPTYPDIRLALPIGRRFGRLVDGHAPDAIHVAIEGPLGLAARRYCIRRGFPFTTSYTTKFPEYLYSRVRFPRRWTYGLLRWFHRPSSGVMVATESLKRELESWGFQNLVRWSRGVDVDFFRPRDKGFLSDPRPILMYVGRVSVEKNLREFLRMDVPGTKYVVGGGPQLEELRKEFSSVVFTGTKQGDELAKYYAAADVFVFPSRTDTFGLVLLEALASGVPVAAYPVTGPIDVIGASGAGVLSDDLAVATRKALEIPSERCREYALQYSWERVTRMFLGNLHPIHETGLARGLGQDSHDRSA